MASRFELLVFDWDGTLLDSAGAIVDAIQAACSDLGLPIPADERARHVIGLGLHDALRYAVPNLPAERYPLDGRALPPSLPASTITNCSCSTAPRP
jgi:phosphoglycolate phosphatase